MTAIVPITVAPNANRRLLSSGDVERLSRTFISCEFAFLFWSYSCAAIQRPADQGFESPVCQRPLIGADHSFIVSSSQQRLNGTL